MRVMILGVIAITSTLTFACTTTTETTVTEPGSAAAAASKQAAATSTWQSKLALSKAGGLHSTAAALSKKIGSQALSVRSGTADAGSCGLSTGDATCDTCIDASCCAEDTACVSDADCTALIACGDACRDDACVSACMSAHPTGATLLNTLMTCMQNDCGTACGSGGSGPPPGTSACGFGSGNPTCDSCLDANCCADANACTSDADCTALIDCAQACTDDACESACETAHPSGAALMNTLSTCAGSTCGSACGGSSSGPGPGAPPGPGSCGLTSGNPTCDTCLDASCCSETTTCLGDADCIALVRCYDACSDDTCAAACDAAHTEGGAKLDAVTSCAQTSCATTCGL